MSFKTRPTLVGVSGGSGGGKSYLAEKLARMDGPKQIGILYVDSYYRCNKHISASEREKLNYDHPDSIEFELLSEHLETLREGGSITVPQYDFATHSRLEQDKPFPEYDVVLVEGILTLHPERVRNQLDFAIFVEAEDSLRFERRLKRDTALRGRTEESVKTQWEETVLPMHQQFVEPLKRFADEVVHTGDVSEEYVRELYERVCSLGG